MKKRGFAVTELLVLMGIVVLILAVLLPAIQKARQDAGRQNCSNNLRMLGLGLHNYHDVYGSLPPGWISKDGAPGTGPRIGWLVSILPFVDQAPLYNQVDFNRPPVQPDGKPGVVFQKPLSVYRCPIDPTSELNPLRGDFATANYSGNYGDIPAQLAPLGLSDLWPGLTDAPMRSRGVFARNSSEGLQDITDGTSNTILVGERSVGSGAGIWAGVTDNIHPDDALTDCSHRSRPNAGWRSFSSRHPGGVQILMGDGAVRFISEKIDSKPKPEMGTYQRLACKNDGQVVGDF